MEIRISKAIEDLSRISRTKGINPLTKKSFVKYNLELILGHETNRLQPIKYQLSLHNLNENGLLSNKEELASILYTRFLIDTTIFDKLISILKGCSRIEEKLFLERLGYISNLTGECPQTVQQILNQTYGESSYPAYEEYLLSYSINEKMGRELVKNFGKRMPQFINYKLKSGIHLTPAEILWIDKYFATDMPNLSKRLLDNLSDVIEQANYIYTLKE